MNRHLALMLALTVAASLALASPATAQDADTDAKDEQIVLSGRLLVGEGDTVDTAVIFNGPASIEGTVTESLVVFNGRTEISGTVEGDVVVFNGSVTVRSGATVGGTSYKVHLDGYNLMPALKGDTKEWPRKEFLYWTDDGNLAGLRYQQYKIAFMEQRGHGFDVWQEPMVTLRLPKLFNLRSDPFERADREGMGYQRWRIDRAFVLVPAQTYVGQWLASFKDFPPRQKPGSFSIGDAMEKLSRPSGSN